MQNIVSRNIKVISNHKILLNKTISIYREAVKYILNVVLDNYTDINSLPSAKDKYNYIENLIHTTVFNIAVYDFDKQFYKFPSYFRRSATADALGMASSYISNLENWKLSKIKKGKPQKPSVRNYFPFFYKGNMYKSIDENTVMLKVYNNSDWIWLTVNLKIKKKDEHHWDELPKKANNPMLKKVGKKFVINYSYKINNKLSKAKIKKQKIVAVDLGLTNSAVCSAMTSKGTVLDRLFIKNSREKDLLSHALNKNKKHFRKYGTANKKLWRYINNLQKEIINKTCSGILQFAIKNKVDVVVLEYLDVNFKSKANNLKEKLHHWCKRGLYNKLEEMLRMHGICISRVCAYNTSKLAFDGSGNVTRSSRGDICTFTTGKVYHADLNATYNIGARYLISEYLKTFSAKKILYYSLAWFTAS